MALGKLPDLAEPQFSCFSNKANFQDPDETGDMVDVSAWHRAGAQRMFTGTHPSRERGQYKVGRVLGTKLGKDRACSIWGRRRSE